jgi:hypothetical protein
VKTEKTITGSALKVISAGKASGGAVKKKGSPPANGGSNSGKKSKGGGGGGGSKPQKADNVKKTDVVDRYKELDDRIDDLSRAYNKASDAADRLWGKARIDQMKKANKMVKEEIDLLKKKKKEAEDYLEEDKDNLDKAAKEAGVKFTYDKEGNITNYTT